MDMKIHHLGYAVNSIEKSIPAFETLGWESSSGITDDRPRKVRIAFLEKDGQLLELVAPLGEDSPVHQALKQNKGVPTPYHICYEVESLDAARAELRQKGFMPFIPAAPAPAIEDRNVEWFFALNLGIIELVEQEKRG